MRTAGIERVARTQRSYCRICTSMCGILVDIETAHELRVDTSIRPGVVSVPHGHEHANVNLLTDSHEVDLLTGMVRYSGIPVTIHAVAAAAVS